MLSGSLSSTLPSARFSPPAAITLSSWQPREGEDDAAAAATTSAADEDSGDRSLATPARLLGLTLLAGKRYSLNQRDRKRSFQMLCCQTRVADDRNDTEVDDRKGDDAMEKIL